MRRHGIAVVNVRIDTDAGAAGRVPERDLAGRWYEREGIFGVDAAFDRMALNVMSFWRSAAFAGGDADLFLDDIDAGDRLGDRMFDRTRVFISMK